MKSVRALAITLQRWVVSTLTSLSIVIGLFAMTVHAGTADQANRLADTQLNPKLKIITNLGDIEIELFPQQAPLSVANFLNYVDSGFYQGTVFHRVIADFMIQGGGFTTDMRRKATQPPITNEANNGLKNRRGSLAMARTSLVNSATSQFFINVKNNRFLNHSSQNFGYAVFGQVTQGMEIVDRIATTTTGAQDRPISPIIIRSIERVKTAA